MLLCDQVNQATAPLLVEKNRRLVIDEPVEARDFMRITDRFRGIYRIYLKCMKASKLEDVNMYSIRDISSLLDKNLPSGQLPHVLWRWHVSLMSPIKKNVTG